MADEQALTNAANYYIKHRKKVNAEGVRTQGYRTDQNIQLLEMTAESYAVSVEDLDKKIKEIERESATRKAA